MANGFGATVTVGSGDPIPIAGSGVVVLGPLTSGYGIVRSGRLPPLSGESLFSSGYSQTFTLFSGSIGSGQISASYLSSGAVISGGITSGMIYPRRCCRCGTDFGQASVTVNGCSGLSAQFCWKCAGYDYNRGYNHGFETREHWIRDTVPFQSGAPLGMIADWCQENNRQKDADWLLTHCSGRLFV